MSRKHRGDDDAPGQDSFLDIVANLVGIMIILVIVVGVRAKGEMERAAPPLSIQAEPEPDVQAARNAVLAVEKNTRALQESASRQQTEIRYRRLERDKLLMMTTALDLELKKQRDGLDKKGQALYDKNKEVAAAQAELERLARKANALDQEEEQIDVIRHLPTPMAKTVFGREVHFRLQGRQLTYVPWDELVERLKSEAKQNAWKLKDTNSITETLGPIRNFMMKYTIERKTFDVETRVGIATQSRIQLDSFELFPVEDRGESVDHSLTPDSELNSILANYQPSHTTVTIWVYPDSFDDYRRIQSSLFERGFLTAARPMPKDAPIGGSPRGTTTAAQ